MINRKILYKLLINWIRHWEGNNRVKFYSKKEMLFGVNIIWFWNKITASYDYFIYLKIFTFYFKFYNVGNNIKRMFINLIWLKEKIFTDFDVKNHMTIYAKK